MNDIIFSFRKGSVGEVISYKMAAKIRQRRYGTKLRHCYRMYSIMDDSEMQRWEARGAHVDRPISLDPPAIGLLHS